MHRKIDWILFDTDTRRLYAGLRAKRKKHRSRRSALGGIGSTTDSKPSTPVPPGAQPMSRDSDLHPDVAEANWHGPASKPVAWALACAEQNSSVFIQISNYLAYCSRLRFPRFNLAHIRSSSLPSDILHVRLSYSRPARLKIRSADADDAGQPRNCAAILARSGNSSSFWPHHTNRSVCGGGASSCKYFSACDFR